MLLMLAIVWNCCACNSGKAPPETPEPATSGSPDTGTPSEPELPQQAKFYSFEELIAALSPVGAWNFDPQSDGKTVADLVGEADGTLVNCATVTGRTGNAVQIYGDEKSYVELGVGTLGKLINGKSAVSVSMWVMPYVNHNNSARLFTLQINKSTAGFHAYYQTESLTVGGRSCLNDGFGSRQFGYHLDDGTIRAFTDTTNEGRWQHIIMTIDFANNSVLAYVNGVKLFSVTQINFSENTFKFGAPSDTDAFGGAATDDVLSFNGLMDEIMVFDRALNTDEIAMLYAEEGTDNSPVADEHFVRSIIEQMADGFAFYKDSNNVLYHAVIEKVLAEDYSICTQVADEIFYIPKTTAMIYFEKSGTAEIRKINGVDYCNLSDLCQANAKVLLVYGDMALVTDGADVFDRTRDAAKLDRLVSFFTDTVWLSRLECEQSRAVVGQAGDFGMIRYCQSPSIAVRGEEIWQSMDSNGKTFVYRSTDGGKSFEHTAVVDKLNNATLFVHNGKLYLIGRLNLDGVQLVGISSSEDGILWSEMNGTQGAFAKGDYEVHGAATPVLTANGRLFKCFGRTASGWSVCRAFMVSASVDADLLDPESWTVSNDFVFHADLFESHPNGTDITRFVYIEEGNAVQGRDGEIYGVYRVNSQPDPGYVMILKLSEDGTTFTFDQNDLGSVIEFDGGVTKFAIRYDATTDLYISFVNHITAKEAVWQRNVLSIAVSKDMYHWETLETVLSDRSMMNPYVSICNHGFQYVDWVIDGGDILLAVREAMNGPSNFHDANFMTFYRLNDYQKIILQQD